MRKKRAANIVTFSAGSSRERLPWALSKMQLEGIVQSQESLCVVIKKQRMQTAANTDFPLRLWQGTGMVS